MSDATSTDPAPDAPDAAGPADEAEEAAPADELRQGHLALFTEALGDRVVGSHIQPGRELWVRVERSAWVEAAELAKHRLGCTFFDYLSAIDWMPSPWGRYEDAVVDAVVAGVAAGAGTAAAGSTAPPGEPETSGVPDPTDPPDPTDSPDADVTGDGDGDGSGGEVTAADAALATGVTGGDTRFQVMCRLVNVRQHHSVILKADLPDGDGTEALRIASLVPVFAGANWHERECWEMFGIAFDGHPGLRHLYLPGAFEGHPLRKDFPLLARLVKPWPGIVDVEPMPEAAEPEASETSETAEGDTVEAEGGHGETATEGATPDDGTNEGGGT